jgi:hypothetical protein
MVQPEGRLMTWPRLIAVDPPECGCTECLIGEYVPLDMATSAHIRALFRGDLKNNLNTGTTLHVQSDGRDRLIVTCDEVPGKTWDLWE